MPPRPEIDLRHLALNATLVIGQGSAALMATTLFSHRALAHESIEPNPPGPILSALGSEKGALEVGSRLALGAVAVVPEVWADVHTVPHHKFPDVNMVPFVELADCLEWIEKQPARWRRAVPEAFNGLDPDARGLTPEEVRELADMVRPNIAGLYDPPADYSPAELDRLLDPDTPRYFYNRTPSAFAQMLRLGKADWQLAAPRSLQSIAPELRDPHSPAFHRLGVLGIRFANVSHYMVSSYYFKEKRSTAELVRARRNSRIAQTLLFGGNIAIQMGINKRPKQWAMVGAAMLTGAGIAVGTFGAVLAGGNFTNADGHAGERRSAGQVIQDVSRAARRTDGNRALNMAAAFFRLKPDVKDDGTYTTNTKIWSLFSFDEVGGQEDHHKRPWRRAYTTATGWLKVAQATFGSGVDALASRGILMHPGKQFGQPEVVAADEPLTLETAKPERYVRPDEPHIATLTIQKYRARTLERERGRKAA